MAYNVPVVYDVFAVAIKEREAFQQLQKCGGEKTHKGRSPTGFFRSPSRRKAAKHIQSCYVPFFDYIVYYYHNLNLNLLNILRFNLNNQSVSL
jgi:hypothetical protein